MYQQLSASVHWLVHCVVNNLQWVVSDWVISLKHLSLFCSLRAGAHRINLTKTLISNFNFILSPFKPTWSELPKMIQQYWTSPFSWKLGILNSFRMTMYNMWCWYSWKLRECHCDSSPVWLGTFVASPPPSLSFSVITLLVMWNNSVYFEWLCFRVSILWKPHIKQC